MASITRSKNGQSQHYSTDTGLATAFGVDHLTSLGMTDGPVGSPRSTVDAEGWNHWKNVFFHGDDSANAVKLTDFVHVDIDDSANTQGRTFVVENAKRGNILLGDGDDDLFGSHGNDVINGGEGADFIRGNQDDDVLASGADADTFSCVTGDGVDIITDFEDGLDLIDLVDFGFTDANSSGAIVGEELRISEIGGDSVIDLGRGQQVTVQNVTGLTDADFVFV